jgi:hypothetical protein
MSVECPNSIFVSVSLVCNSDATGWRADSNFPPSISFFIF